MKSDFILTIGFMSTSSRRFVSELSFCDWVFEDYDYSSEKGDTKTKRPMDHAMDDTKIKTVAVDSTE